MFAFDQTKERFKQVLLFLFKLVFFYKYSTCMHLIILCFFIKRKLLQIQMVIDIYIYIYISYIISNLISNNIYKSYKKLEVTFNFVPRQNKPLKFLILVYYFKRFELLQDFEILLIFMNYLRFFFFFFFVWILNFHLDLTFLYCYTFLIMF